jgi:hypothetical protein
VYRSKHTVPQHISGYLKNECIESFDKVIRWATDAGLWTTLTFRGAVAAGGGNNPAAKAYPNVFTNETLRLQFYAMWRFLGSRYASFDRIAAYEILSEPRMIPPGGNLGPTLSEFYEAGCAAVHASDPRTPCLVGPAKIYNIYNVTEGMPTLRNKNVIYTADFFEPFAYVKQIAP